MNARYLAACAAWAMVGCAAANADPAAEATAPRQAPPAEATRVEVAGVSPSDADLEITLPGEIEGARDALLSSAQGGQIEKVLVRKGQRVRKGQALMHIDRSLYRVHLSRADVELAQARQDHQRMVRLGNAVTAVERENSETRLRLAESTHKLQSLQLSRATIRAPFAGTIADVDVETGEVAPPGTPLLRLVQLDPLIVSLSVPDRDVVALAPGDEVQVRTNATTSLPKGVIKRISPAADLKTRAFTVEVEISNGDRSLLPGMIANVSISKRLDSGAVVIPQDWLVTTRHEVGVFLVDEDGEQGPRARWRPVVPSQVVRDQVVVGEGIDSGDRIVVTGHRELAEGDRLIIAREGRCCTHGRAMF